ncbi:hypothetical protein ACS0TY_022253 [Phlomoides rotata]
MHSLLLHSFVLPCRSSIHNPSSQACETKINRSLHRSSPPENIFADALLSLRTCSEIEDPKTGSCFHAQILKLGIETDVFVGNTLLNMYSKCDQIKDARNLFDQMPHRTVVSWTSMMSAYHRNGLPDEAISLFLGMLESLQPNEFTLSVLLKVDQDLVEAIHSYAIKSLLISDKFLQNSIVDAYAKSGKLAAAEKLLQRLHCRDVISWTSVISGCVSHGNAGRALVLFRSMQEDGVFPNDVAMMTVLQACSEIKDCKIMQGIHGMVLKSNWCMSSLVLNSLIEMYSINSYFIEAMSIFCQFCFNNEGSYPSPETMANLLRGCGKRGSLKMGRVIHGYLIKHGFLPCTIADNSLMNMYAKNGDKDSALLVFRKMANRDVISWNTMIKCFVKNDQPIVALELLGEIHRDSVSPDFVTFLTLLEACSDLAMLIQGQLIHGYLTKTGLLGDIFVQNALIDTYAKSGKLGYAENIFKEMDERDVGSWNSIIAAYGINGNGANALKSFTNLERSGAGKPNAITFMNVLSACAHAGLVKEGLELFNSMDVVYGIMPEMEHYACMVDLLGRAGRVEEAADFIHKMPVKPGPDVWGALLSACVLIGNVNVAERAAKEFAALEPGNSIWRVALSNVYAAVGKWDEVGEIRAELNGSKKMIKETGWSSVDIEGCEFRFIAGDTKHPESAVIYDVVAGLHNHTRDAVRFSVEYF